MKQTEHCYVKKQGYTLLTKGYNMKTTDKRKLYFYWRQMYEVDLILKEFNSCLPLNHHLECKSEPETRHRLMENTIMQKALKVNNHEARIRFRKQAKQI